MIKYNFVPSGFGSSYTVPIPKNYFAHFNKAITTDDFRGISISSVVSKIFEKCILDRYSRFFETSDKQFGFKRNIGCSHAIYSVRNVIDRFVNNGSTVNLCALDMSKAFDRMSHQGLYIKLMNRMIPTDLLATIEYWFSICSTCVRWANCHSHFYALQCGVRQGGVLSPYLFSVFINDIFDAARNTRCGCHFGSLDFNILMYADDIILIAPSVTALQQLCLQVEQYLLSCDMLLNAKKSVCLRIGPRYKDFCQPIITAAGDSIEWATNIRYLGVQIVSGKTFSISLSENVKSFYRSFNSITNQLKNKASEECLIRLIYSKCVPVLLYGLETCVLKDSQIRHLDFLTRKTMMRVFKTSSVDIVDECMTLFNIELFSKLVLKRKRNFACKILMCENTVCTFFHQD
jgi:hypothetical protein